MYVDRTWRGDSTQTGSGVIFCGHEEKRQGKTNESGLIKTVHRRLQRGRTIGCEGRSQFESRALLTAWSKVEQIGTIGNSIQYGRNFMAPSFRRNRPDRGRGRPVVLPFARHDDKPCHAETAASYGCQYNKYTLPISISDFLILGQTLIQNLIRLTPPVYTLQF